MRRAYASVALLCLVGWASLAEGDPAGPDIPLPPDLGTRKTGSDWPVFLGPTGDSISAEKGLVTPWPAQGPRVVWYKKLGEGYAPPTVSRGRIFLFDRLRDRARLQACKSETGEHLWTFEYSTDYEDYYNYSNGPRCCPVVDGGRVYILGAEGMLHCVRAEDGKVVWKVDTRKEFNVIQNFFGVGSAPVIEGDLLIVQVGGSPPGSENVPFMDLKGNGSGIVAFNKYTGEVKYRVSDELASYASPVLATIGSRRWCFVFARGGLLGLEPTTGKIDFHYPWRSRLLESVNAANPVVAGSRVLISETYGPGSALLEVAPGKVTEVWTDADNRREKRLQCHWNTPIHVAGYLYGCSGRHASNAELRCLELATGKVQWSIPDLTRTSLMLVDDHFVCMGEYGDLSLFKVSPRKYELVSRVRLRRPDADPAQEGAAAELLSYPCWSAPILAHGLMYIRGGDHVVCLEVIPARK